MRKIIIIICLIPVSLYAQGGHLIENPLRNIPKWVRNEFTAQNLDQRYTIIYKLYPFYLKGDFNGDGRGDIAIQLQENTSKKDGIALFHRKRTQEIHTQILILGAGNTAWGGESDFSWVTGWSILRPDNRGYAFKIQLKDKEKKISLIYWNGKRYMREKKN